MVDVCLLGTGGMMPLVNRFLTSLYVRCNGIGILIDCGEGTQIAIKKAELSVYDIDYILITHFHADHISGLPGLLLSMGNSEKKTDVTIIGPKGLTSVVKSLRVIAPELPFKINLIELSNDFGELDLKDFKIEYFTLKHKILCIGFNILINRLPKFIKEKAIENNIPIKFWNKLQHLNVCIDEETGKKYEPYMVMGDDRKGIKISYFTDTRPCDNIFKWTENSDLTICEGMYGDSEKLQNAKKYMHMTMYEACEIANVTKPKILWLTHFSPSENRPHIYEDTLKKIYSEVRIVKDGEKINLNFV